MPLRPHSEVIRTQKTQLSENPTQSGILLETPFACFCLDDKYRNYFKTMTY